MASRKLYGASDMKAFSLNEKLPACSSDVLESLWIPTSSSSFHGSNSMVNFENVSGGDSLERSFFQQIDKEENGDDDDYDGGGGSGSHHQPGKKRRLSVDQVQFLEKNFETENKLEPERKALLAKELGLQPRQVAIWFQNRRARFKNKQLEKEYDSLKASYDKLKADHDKLIKENGSLTNEDMLVLREKGKDGKGNMVELESVDDHAIKSLELKSQNENGNAGGGGESVTNVGMVEMEVVACKQEDAASSAKSDVFDSDSPYCTENHSSLLLEPADSSHVFEPADQSDFSQDEGDDLSKTLLPPQPPYFLKLEEDDSYYHHPAQNVSTNFAFPLEDQQPFCFWPY